MTIPVNRHKIRSFWFYRQRLMGVDELNIRNKFSRSPPFILSGSVTTSLPLTFEPGRQRTWPRWPDGYILRQELQQCVQSTIVRRRQFWVVKEQNMHGFVLVGLAYFGKFLVYWQSQRGHTNLRLQMNLLGLLLMASLAHSNELFPQDYVSARARFEEQCQKQKSLF